MRPGHVRVIRETLSGISKSTPAPLMMDEVFIIAGATGQMEIGIHPDLPEHVIVRMLCRSDGVWTDDIALKFSIDEVDDMVDYLIDTMCTIRDRRASLQKSVKMA